MLISGLWECSGFAPIGTKLFSYRIYAVESRENVGRGELMPFESSDLMGKLLIDRFETGDFLAHRVELGQQLQGLFG